MNKIRETCLERYGVEYTTQCKEIIDNMLFSRNINRKYNITEFEIYKYNVVKLTLKNKKDLFINWSDYDYYDNEYIKNYLNLHSNSKKYPTIDHKNSVFFVSIII